MDSSWVIALVMGIGVTLIALWLFFDVLGWAPASTTGTSAH